MNMLTEFLDPKLVSFKEVDRADVSDFVKKHYLKAFPASAKLYIGIFYNENMVGMVVYGSPTAPSISRAIFKDDVDVSHKEIFELKRLFLVDDETLLPADAKRNLAGYSISNGNKMVEKKFPEVKVIVTYSDSNHHSGAVYKATNAIFQGEYNNKKRWVYPVGSFTQRSWVRKNLRTNKDWKLTAESLEISRDLWKMIF